MRACVIGAGAIGSLFAAHLATVADVLVLTRRQEHAQELNDQGLRVSGGHDFTARVTAASDPRDLPDFDVGIIATKVTAEISGQFPCRWTTSSAPSPFWTVMIVARGNRPDSDAAAASRPVAFVAMMPTSKSGR